MSLTLTQKISGLIALPLSTSLLLAGISVKGGWERKKGADAIEINAQFFSAVSEFIHDAQKERGKSAMYIGGKIQMSELESQRATVNEKSQTVDRLNARLSQRMTLWETVKNELAAVRKQADAKDNPPQVSMKYGTLIGKAIDVQVAATSLASLDGIETRLLSLTVLEIAKENSGRMRASMTNVLNQDAPIAIDRLSLIESYKAGVAASLESPALIISPQGRKSLDEFRKSPEWSRVLQVYSAIVQNAEKGGYGHSPADFFKDVTQAIDNVGKIVTAEIGDIKASAASLRSRLIRDLWVTLGLATVIGFFLVVSAWAFIRSLSARLTALADGLSGHADEVATSSRQISKTTEELSSGATEQAAALQETAASLDEINAMLQKSRDGADRSNESSKTSHRVAQDGQRTISEMIEAIRAIDEGNSKIVSQVEEGNREIHRIVKVISDIGEKTKIINDIVFQTKLLSFNASVEAARAGEHGKGFAVVAEEVGNLAQMSGRASQEISQMLESSIREVGGIVANTKNRVDALIQEGKTRIAAGTSKAEECDEVLRQIVAKAAEVGTLVAEIATATQEQSSGLQEVAKAMNQLDQVTQLNTTATQNSSTSARELAEQAEALRSLSAGLAEMVLGRARRDPSGTVTSDLPKPASKAPSSPVMDSEKNAA